MSNNDDDDDDISKIKDILETGLLSHKVLLSVIGDHAGCTVEENYARKIHDIAQCGESFWLMKSASARFDDLSQFCKAEEKEIESEKEKEKYVFILWIAAGSKGGAKPTSTSTAVTAISADGEAWQPYPTAQGMGALTGRLDRHTVALRLDAIAVVERRGIVVDLWEYESQHGGAVKLRIGASTVCATRGETSEHPARMKSHLRKLVAIGRLKHPFVYWVK